jgi:hypothetical protein
MNAHKLIAAAICAAIAESLFACADPVLAQAESAKTPGPSQQSPTIAPPPNMSITSQNQSGGFTGYNAGTVNLGPSLRTLTVEQSKSLMQMLSRAPKGRLEVRAVNGDSESIAFAKQIHGLLSAAGYNVGDRISTGIWAGDPLPSLAFAVPGMRMDEFTSPVLSALRQIDPKTVFWGNPNEPPTVMVCPKQ